MVVTELTQNEDDARRVSGGYQVVASSLEKEFPDDAPFSRQRVHNWWKRRASTLFPAGWTRETKSSTVRRFYVDDVLEWYRWYRLSEYVYTLKARVNTLLPPPELGVFTNQPEPCYGESERENENMETKTEGE